MLTEFCIETGRGDAISAVDKDTVTDFIAKLENVERMAARTIKKYVSRLSLYFRYLESKRRIKVNLAGRRGLCVGQEKPFNEAEIVTLLTGKASRR